MKRVKAPVIGLSEASRSDILPPRPERNLQRVLHVPSVNRLVLGSIGINASRAAPYFDGIANGNQILGPSDGGIITDMRAWIYSGRLDAPAGDADFVRVHNKPMRGRPIAERSAKVEFQSCSTRKVCFIRAFARPRALRKSHQKRLCAT